MDQRVQFIIAIMRDDFHRNLSLQKLARTINISQSRFHDLFKAETGTSPARFLHCFRMERARKLCETTPMSVKQIMNCVGIRDRSHFDRDFKNLYALTPAQYKANVRLVSPIREAQTQRVVGFAILILLRGKEPYATLLTYLDRCMCW